MAGEGINWGLIQPLEGPAPQLASISSMLSQFAARRQQQQAQEEAKAQQEREFQQRMQERYEDNARAERQFSFQQEMERRRLGDSEAARKAEQETQGFKDLREAYPQIMAARNNPAEMARIASLYPSLGFGPKAAPATPAPAPGVTESPDNPEVSNAANAAPAAAPQAPPAPPVYQLTGPAGRVLEIAPDQIEANRKAESKRRADEFVKAVAPHLKNDPLAGQALQETYGMMLSGESKEDPFQAFQKRYENLQADLRARENTRVMAGGKAQAEADRQAGIAMRGEQLEERKINNFKQSVDWKGLVTSGRKLHGAVANLASDNPKDALGHREAMMSIGSYFRSGGVPTDQEMGFLYHDLGGKLGNGAQSFFARMTTGDLSPKELAMVRDTAKTAHAEWTQNVENAVSQAQETFGDDERAMKKIHGLFQGMGVDITPVLQKQAKQKELEDGLKAAGF